MEQLIPIFYIDARGKIIGHFINEKQSATRLFRQLEIFRDPVRELDLSREVVAEKIANQRELLKRYEKTVGADKLDKPTKKLKQTSDKLSAMQTLDELCGTEGLASKIYFATFTDLLDQKWKKRSQHPAHDPVNTLLNYGYAFLAREVRVAAALTSMDARIAFFNADDGRKDSLIFELMDFFRQPVIDRFVLNLLNKRMIQPEHFTTTPEECRLTDDGRIVFCNRYEEYISKKYREYRDKTFRDVINEHVKKFSAYLNR